jgi:predicted dinucleotide-binding enzyme
MDIGIIGAGNIGSALAKQFAKAGHRVAIANSRGPETLADDDRADLPVEDRLAIPIAADDEEAKATVAALVEDIGFGALDMGSLEDSKSQEPDTPIYGNMITLREAREVAG